MWWWGDKISTKVISQKCIPLDSKTKSLERAKESSKAVKMLKR
jgi:hypothetical protein